MCSLISHDKCTNILTSYVEPVTGISTRTPPLGERHTGSTNGICSAFRLAWRKSVYSNDLSWPTSKLTKSVWDCTFYWAFSPHYITRSRINLIICPINTYINAFQAVYPIIIRARIAATKELSARHVNEMNLRDLNALDKLLFTIKLEAHYCSLLAPILRSHRPSTRRLYSETQM